MSRSHQCHRSFTREKLNYTAWNAFFAEARTPFIFKENAGDDRPLPTCMENIVGYISNVVMDNSGFSYTLHHIAEDIHEDDFIEHYTIEPIFTQTVLKGEVLASKILCLVMVPHATS